uniref:uncharacterized protein LOC127063331 isoform X3 n=1 Tax=Vespula vulgaris TaxID=7454 RepID=UPI00223B9F41|nr:uncharacterized protein LOC127063331 isoform X3 [Vespula vulgaris]
MNNITMQEIRKLNALVLEGLYIQRETADATRRLGDPWITRGSAKSSVSDFRQRFDRSSSTTTLVHSYRTRRVPEP